LLLLNGFNHSLLLLARQKAARRRKEWLKETKRNKKMLKATAWDERLTAE
jgi:hypothetical protein